MRSPPTPYVARGVFILVPIRRKGGKLFDPGFWN